MQQISEKIKPMSIEELILAIDRLTRFKPPEIKYNRVFREIIAKHLISPKIGFKEYERLEEQDICTIIETIFNNSIKKLTNKTIENSLYKLVFEMENNLYEINSSTKMLMQAKIPYETILQLYTPTNANAQNNLCKNLKILNEFLKEKTALKKIRKKHKTMFPIEKIVLAEGITEEILLPKFAQILDYDFDENGIIVIPAGGKNQVAKEYMNLKDKLKKPIIILLDADATEIGQKISNKLREIDKLILIEKGEFEDILPLSLLTKTINYQFINIFNISEEDFSTNTNRVKNLEEIYRINGLGEFKKSEFAHNINIILNGNSKDYASNEIKHIIQEIKNI